MLKVNPKTATLATPRNFDVIEIIDAGPEIRAPKFMNLDWFQTRYVFAVNQCN